MKKIDDPKQNQHCWCGILTTDEKEGSPLKPNQKYVFLKLNKESHFISHGTIITDILQVNVGEVDKSILKALETIKGNSLVYDGLFDKIKKDIKYCLSIAGVETASIIIITGIDNSETTPLAGDINEFTKDLFTSEKWLKEDEDRKGSKDIRIGLLLPSMPFPD